MVTTSANPASRYRRRILGLGALATGALYVIGAPIVNGRIEADLDARVPTELIAAGFDGVVAEFSGQDGILRCGAPLDDPEGAIAAAYDIKGVRAIELDRSCRVNSASSGTGSGDDSDAAAADGSPSSAAPTTPSDKALVDGSVPDTTVTPPTTDTDLLSMVDVVAANSDLAFLSVLLEDVEIGGTAGPLTFFAPSNEAFDKIPADQLARLQGDPELIQRIVNHHVAGDVLTSADLVDGALTTLDGGTLAVDVGDTITVGGGTLTDVDIESSDGIVHVIDTVLLPDDVVLAAETADAPVAVTWGANAFVLTGVVASEIERDALVAAAVSATGVDAVTDQLSVDPVRGADDVVIGRLTTMMPAMPGNLSSGEVGCDGTVVYATGVYLTEDGRDAFVAAAGEAEVDPGLEPTPEATAGDAVDLEAQLNEFVAGNPILFQPTSAVLDESAAAVLDRLASDVQQFTGVSITVEGHTDSDGDPAINQRLSQARAEAVRDGLVERGVAAESIEATGFGSEQPMLVDGIEDKDASRRVEFRVTTA